jgi:hypothetical protein
MKAHSEKTKGKPESLNEKLGRTNNKDMKEHLYIKAAFFEQLKDIFILPSNDIYNIPRPELWAGSLSHLKTFTIGSLDIPIEYQQSVEEYGEILMESYLRNVFFDYNIVGYKR